jgi:transposase InsO family protein
MNLHSRAKTTPICRETIVRRVLEEGWSRRRTAQAMSVSRRTVLKWVRRFINGEGLRDRSSRPLRIALRTSPQAEQLVLELRRRKLSALAVSEVSGVPRSTVGRILRRHRLSRARDLEVKEPPRRYEHEAPGDMLHLDIKKLGRIDGIGHRFAEGRKRGIKRRLGWECVHVCVDDNSRVAYVEVLPDEQKHTTSEFLLRAVQWFGRQGVVARRILTDNGSAYKSKLFARVCAELSARHCFTRPYRPCTNGKAERFIQSALREWAYRRPYASSQERTAALSDWLHFYNHHRKHSSIGAPPASRVNNLLSSDS